MERPMKMRLSQAAVFVCAGLLAGCQQQQQNVGQGAVAPASGSGYGFSEGRLLEAIS